MKIEKEHKKETLMHWTKEQLAEYIMCLEHNNNALHETIDQQANNILTYIDNIEKGLKTERNVYFKRGAFSEKHIDRKKYHEIVAALDVAIDIVKKGGLYEEAQHE